MTRLVAMFERMAAVRAAGICEEIYDDDDIARLLARMKDQTASEILANMKPERAARVTEMLME
jgi:flagellar motility protein MotE (MotC chaperone)